MRLPRATLLPAPGALRPLVFGPAADLRRGVPLGSARGGPASRPPGSGGRRSPRSDRWKAGPGGDVPDRWLRSAVVAASADGVPGHRGPGRRGSGRDGPTPRRLARLRQERRPDSSRPGRASAPPARTRSGRSSRQVSIRSGRYNLDEIHLSPPSNPRGRGVGRDLTARSRRSARMRGIRGADGHAGRAGPGTEVIIVDAIPDRGLAGPFPHATHGFGPRVRRPAASWCRSVATSRAARTGRFCRASREARARGTSRPRARGTARVGIEAGGSCPTSYRVRRDLARAGRRDRGRDRGGRQPSPGIPRRGLPGGAQRVPQRRRMVTRSPSWL